MMEETTIKETTTEPQKLLCPKAGTATSTPIDKQSSRIDMVIPNTMLWMQKNAYEPTTIKKTAKLLRHLKNHCDTTDPEAVKFYISKKQCSNAHKENLIEAYATVIKSLGLTWEQPFYTRYSKKRRAPKEELINFIIQHTRIEMATKLAIIKDLGTRPKELTWLTIKDIDLNSGVVSITGAKHTIGREGRVRKQGLELLRVLMAKKRLNQNSRIYNGSSDNLSANYRQTRNRIAERYKMPELKQIQLYDFRRFMASKAYKLSRHNLIEVKQLLGHKHIEQTEHYISLFDEKDLKRLPIKAITDEEKAKCIEDDCDYIYQQNQMAQCGLRSQPSPFFL